MYRYYITKKNDQGAMHLPEQPVPATTYSYGQNGSNFQYIGQVWAMSSMRSRWLRAWPLSSV